MNDEFVIGFMPEDPDGLTPVDIVAEIVGITENEVRDSPDVFEITELCD